jgi:ribose 5-phosphate isomerase B
MNKIIIGSDHAGFSLKEAIRPFLADMNLAVTDIGAYSTESVDYPDYGSQVAQRVASGEFERGILVCGSGVGMTIVANKYPLIRAVLCLDEETARLSREHNDANILVLAGRRTDLDKAKTIISVWLETAFAGERHQRRLDKIREIERQSCR